MDPARLPFGPADSGNLYLLPCLRADPVVQILGAMRNSDRIANTYVLHRRGEPCNLVPDLIAASDECRTSEYAR